MPSAIASETGKASQAGSSARPPPAPPVPKVSATLIAASAMTDLDREVHLAGDQRQRQADRDDADEGRLLEDVEEDADLEELRDEVAKAASAISRMIQTRLSSTKARSGPVRAPALGVVGRPSITATPVIAPA